jgi:hypothetical protein
VSGKGTVKACTDHVVPTATAVLGFTGSYVLETESLIVRDQVLQFRQNCKLNLNFFTFMGANLHLDITVTLDQPCQSCSFAGGKP